MWEKVWAKLDIQLYSIKYTTSDKKFNSNFLD